MLLQHQTIVSLDESEHKQNHKEQTDNYEIDIEIWDKLFFHWERIQLFRQSVSAIVITLQNIIVTISKPNILIQGRKLKGVLTHQRQNKENWLICLYQLQPNPFLKQYTHQKCNDRHAHQQENNVLHDIMHP